VLGDAGVGKMSLIVQFCMGWFPSLQDGKNENEINRRLVDIDGASTLVAITAVGSGEEHRPLRDQMSRHTSAIIIVYDITSHESFLHAQKLFEQVQRARMMYGPPTSGPLGSHPHPQLLHIDEATANPIPLILVGNKLDLQGRRQVRTQEAENFALGSGIAFVEVSAKSRPDAEKVFFEAARMIRMQIEKQEIHKPSVASASSTQSRAGTSSGERRPSIFSSIGRSFRVSASRDSTSGAQSISYGGQGHRGSKDEGIEDAAERALDYHRAGSRSGGGGGSFSSYNSNASRFGTGRDHRESSTASTNDYQYRGPRGYDPVQSPPQTATKHSSHTKSPPRKPVPTSHTQSLGSQHDEQQQQSPPTHGQHLQHNLLKKKNKPSTDVEAIRVQLDTTTITRSSE
jgi:GTPase KRas protein